MKPWWEEWPGRLQYELQALDAAGIPCKRDERAFGEGKLELNLSPVVDGKRLDLIAKFPELYPYFRFEVIAPTLDLPHHQNPFGKNLCLIGRETRNWSVHDTLAEFITERLPQLLKAARSDANENLQGIELPQGEPFTDYYQYAAGAVFVDSDWKIASDERRGKLDLGIRLQGARFQGAVLEVRGAKNRILAECDSKIRRLAPTLITADWIRLGSPIRRQDAYGVAAEIFQHHRDLETAHWAEIANQLWHVIAVVFPDEVEYRKKQDAWLFLVRIRSKRNAKPYWGNTYLVREARFGRADLSRRIPEVRPVEQKKVALFGLGCVGAPSAIEFARVGIGELRLLDYDFVEAGAVVRWPLGSGYAGSPKAEALREFVEAQYPYTTVKPYVHRLGATIGNKSSDSEVLDEALADADLIYDATTEVGVQYFLADLARKRQIPYVMAWATNGGWGGLIARFVPGQTKGCWSCLACARTDNTIPSPPEKPGDQVQPLGCAAPTFTGTSFDITHVSLSAVRLAVATITRGVERGYPDFDWDVGVLALRNEDGTLIAPKWETHRLNRHPLCQACKDPK